MLLEALPMPSNSIHRTAADEVPIHHDASGTAFGVGSSGDANASTTAPSRLVSADNPPSISKPDENSGPEGKQITTSKSSSSTHDGLLHIPDPVTSRRPIETSIWDWDTPLDGAGEGSSYLYEPQGELLAQDQQRPGRNEFSIPQAVSGSGINWPFQGQSTQSDNDGFAIPRRPNSSLFATAGVKRKSASDQSATGTSKQPDPKRMSRNMSDAGEEPPSPKDTRPTAPATRSQTGLVGRARSGTDTTDSRSRLPGADPESLRPGGARRGIPPESTHPMVLPPRKVFPIQIGDKLFRLSGASISSDAPSYFSQFFEEQLKNNEGAENVRTLYIDRDPATFEDISLHLQGYHVEPRDGPHFVKLFADAQFFSLPRLTAQLFSSTIYIRIGDEEFQIPRDVFSNPGDSPNYFSLGFAIFFTTPTDAFPGLSQRSLLRPPSILPPSVPNRSAKTFADLLHILKGYPVEIRSEEHRAELLRDARYFHLKGLEQRIIPHTISYNLARQKTEIVIRLEDIRQSGISFVADNASGNSSGPSSPASSTVSTNTNSAGWIFYQRPYVDAEAYSLIVEINGEESTTLSIAPGSPSSPARAGRATFHKQTLSRITSLFSVIANKMNVPITQPLGLMMMERGAGVASLPVSPGNTGISEERVKVRIGTDADVCVDGQKWLVGANDDDDAEEEDESEMDVDRGESAAAAARQKKRKRSQQDDDDEGEDWVVRKAQFRLRVQPMSGGVQSGKSGMEVILGAVKIEAHRSERQRNAIRGFLV